MSVVVGACVRECALSFRILQRCRRGVIVFIGGRSWKYNLYTAEELKAELFSFPQHSFRANRFVW